MRWNTQGLPHNLRHIEVIHNVIHNHLTSSDRHHVYTQAQADFKTQTESRRSHRNRHNCNTAISACSATGVTGQAAQSAQATQPQAGQNA